MIGGGLTGMATACRLAVRGRRVTVLEAHRTLGGCAGYFRRAGHAFDVGCTTLVDYAPAGVGGRMLAEIGLPDALLEHLPGYTAWVGGERIELHADAARWRAERAAKLGDTPGHRRLWALLDRLADAFWRAAGRGVRMPIRTAADLRAAAGSLPLKDWPLLRYLRWTALDAVRWAGCGEDAKLRGFLSMVVQDTVHGELATAPLVNASLGLAIRGAIARPRGGMYGFWNAFESRAEALGVVIRRSSAVRSVRETVRGEPGRFHATTASGDMTADVVVCTLPIWDAARIMPSVGAALRPWCERDAGSLGGAAMLTLAVPEAEVAGQAFTHHQFLPETQGPLGDGNNSFLSMSSSGDELSAPVGWRAVMMSTHVELAPWEARDEATYDAAKRAIGERLLSIARTAYPALGEQARWLAVASPRTYERFTRRHRGAVGGTRLSLANSNQRAVPQDVGVAGWVQAGDTTWPGLGTTACAIGSGLAADLACRWA